MKKSFSSYVKDYLMLAVLVALIILFSILGPAMANRAFFNFSNLLTMLNQNAYLVILGVGITFIMLGGGMDPVYLERRHLSAHRRHQQNHLCI